MAINEAQKLQRLLWRKLPAVQVPDGAEALTPVMLGLGKTTLAVVSHPNTYQVQEWVGAWKRAQRQWEGRRGMHTPDLGHAGSRRRFHFAHVLTKACSLCTRVVCCLQESVVVHDFIDIIGIDQSRSRLTLHASALVSYNFETEVRGPKPSRSFHCSARFQRRGVLQPHLLTRIPGSSAIPQADVVTNHIRHHLSQLKDASQYAIALEAQVAPPPAAGSTEKEMLAFQAEDVIYLTRSVGAHAHPFHRSGRRRADRVRS